MFETDRDFVKQQVLRVMADWGVAPSSRGTGPGDAENWVDYIVAAKGWEPYWEDTRMPREFTEKGYHKGVPPTPQPWEPPPSDPYMAKLNAMDAKLDQLVNGLRSYFR